MDELRKGITTGTCAAAAAKAATALLIKGTKSASVMVTLPAGNSILVPIHNVFLKEDSAYAVVIKDGGDDPDITHGAEIVVAVQHAKSYELTAGEGVGTVTKAGLAIPPGQAAINPVPRAMIKKAVEEVYAQAKVRVIVSVPKGAELAKRTLNPRLGIVGGISILGTTGIVEPMSEEAYKNSLVPQIEIAKEAGMQALIFVPGKMGERSVIRHLDVHEDAVVETSNFIGFMLEKAVKAGYKKVLLWGHIAKLVKLAAGNMHTHNRISDARFETLTAHAALLGRGDLAPRLMACNTVEEAVSVLRQEGMDAVLMAVAERARKRVEDFLFGDAEIAVVFTDLKDNVLSWSSNLEKFLQEEKWQKKFMW